MNTGVSVWLRDVDNTAPRGLTYWLCLIADGALDHWMYVDRTSLLRNYVSGRPFSKLAGKIERLLRRRYKKTVVVGTCRIWDVAQCLPVPQSLDEGLAEQVSLEIRMQSFDFAPKAGAIS